MKNKTSLFLVIFVASLFVIPEITLAAWWNPVSWFEKEKTFQLNATSTKNSEDLESATVFKSNNIPNNTNTSFSKTENKSSEFVNTVLNESNIENVAELKATIFQLQKEITLLQNKEQAKKTLTEPAEKIIYRDRIIEKPTEKIVYRDNIAEKPTEKIIYQEKIVEKPVEKIVYRDRVVEKPVEKIVYQDRVVQGTCSANNTSSVISESSSSSSEYSDYNFDYEWNSDWNYGGVLSCPSTSRNILLKKAVIKISDESLQTLRDLEKETQPNTSLALPIVYRLYGAGMGNSYVNLERQDDYTFVWFGGSIPFNCSGTTNSLSFYLGASPEWSKASTPTIRNLIPVMSQWEIWDGTTNKPVKIK